jgi:hypothetical protein
MPGGNNRRRPERANSETVWGEVVAVLVVGPAPGPGNSEGGPSEIRTAGEPAPRADYTLEVPVTVHLQASAEPGPGDSDGGGYASPTNDP